MYHEWILFLLLCCAFLIALLIATLLLVYNKNAKRVDTILDLLQQQDTIQREQGYYIMEINHELIRMRG